MDIESTTNITYNKATTAGGGMYFENEWLYIKDTLIVSHNAVTTATGKGGGMYIAQGADLETNGYSVDSLCWITNNQAAYGGGVYITGGLFESDNDYQFVIRDNTASANGGGMYVDAQWRRSICE